MRPGFPPGFLWGTANAGFQSEAGQGRHTDPNSDWFVWTHDPANIADGTVSGDQPESGPGFWKLFRDDLDLAANQLHNDAFRFSVEWPRIFPRSTESVDVGARIDQQELRRLDKLANQSAVRHYRRVLRAANRRGLTPFVTLHHWTIPSWLHEPVATRAALASRGPNDPLPESRPVAGSTPTPSASSASTPPISDGSSATGPTIGTRSTSRWSR